MAIKLTVPAEKSDTIRSSIFHFLNMREDMVDRCDALVLITVFNTDDFSEYNLEFGDSAEADAFLRYFPSVVHGIDFDASV